MIHSVPLEAFDLASDYPDYAPSTISLFVLFEGGCRTVTESYTIIVVCNVCIVCMVTAVCFDLDGTLFDDTQYVRAGFRAAAEFVERETGESIYDDLVAAYFEDGIRERTFDHVLESRELSQSLVPELVAAYHDNEATLRPYADTLPVLETLTETYRLGLLTGGHNGRGKLARLNLTDCFDAVVVAPDDATTKRECEPFEQLLDDLSVSPQDAVYVGDRPSLDFPRPNELGMHTLRVLAGQYAQLSCSLEATPDRTVDSLAAVPDAVASFDS